MFLVDAETTSTRFIRTLLMQESGHAICHPQRADYEGGRILLLLDRLYFILEDNDENRHRILTLAVSSAVCIAQRNGEIRELSLVVNGIAMFANQSSRQEDLDSLYEISLRIL